jgi:succinate dehydrogenase flavin-adding protein (antitoxin of CptAB toxin-antitoxin module)
MITRQMFIGVEAEGPGRGLLTLFIPRGAVTKKNIKKILQRITTEEITRLYFGAGNRRGLTEMDLELIRSVDEEISILAEIGLKDLLELHDKDALHRIDLILTLPIKSNATIPTIQHIKFVSNRKLLWYEQTEPPYETLLSDDLYLTDMKV